MAARPHPAARHAARAALAVSVLVGSLVLAVGRPAGASILPQPKIVGGTTAAPGAWPWQVALLERGISNNYQAQFCGGSIIDKSWVLTAGHCVLGRTEGQRYLSPGDVDVLVGTNSLASGGTRIHAVEIRVNPTFNGTTFDHDLALIRLDHPTKLAPVPLVAQGSAELASGTPLTATGWGSLSDGGGYPTTLRQVVLSSQTDSQCLAALGPDFRSSSMTCAADPGKDTCSGDSGGPLMADLVGGWTLVGITSWGNGCADPLYPGVYSDVRMFSSWVAQQIRFGPHSDAVGFVKQQYQDLFDRPPTNNELFFGVVGLNGGQAPAEFAEGLLASPAYDARTGAVVRLYRAAFLRDPDTAGLTYWRSRVNRVTTRAAVAQYFADSAEFATRYGALGDAAFVDQMYQNVLGRLPDAAGSAYWTAQLQSHTRTRGQVLSAFSESVEYRAATRAHVDVYSRFIALMRRVPTGGELTTWLVQPTSSLTPFLLGSFGYAARF